MWQTEASSPRNVAASLQVARTDRKLPSGASWPARSPPCPLSPPPSRSPRRRTRRARPPRRTSRPPAPASSSSSAGTAGGTASAWASGAPRATRCRATRTTRSSPPTTRARRSASRPRARSASSSPTAKSTLAISSGQPMTVEDGDGIDHTLAAGKTTLTPALELAVDGGPSAGPHPAAHVLARRRLEAQARPRLSRPDRGRRGERQAPRDQRAPARAVPVRRRPGRGAVVLAARRARGAGCRRALVRAREPPGRGALRRLRRRAQPGVPRRLRREAGGDAGRDETAGEVLFYDSQVADDALLLEHRRPDAVGGGRLRPPGPAVSRLGAGSLTTRSRPTTTGARWRSPARRSGGARRHGPHPGRDRHA